MGPLLTRCGGCGVRLRLSQRDAARGRGCPRCSFPLEVSFGLDTALAQDDAPMANTPSGDSSSRGLGKISPRAASIGLVAMLAAGAFVLGYTRIRKQATMVGPVASLAPSAIGEGKHRCPPLP